MVEILRMEREDSYWFMHANCKMQEMANWCVPVVWQARRRREGIEQKRCEAGAKRWENGRTIVQQCQLVHSATPTHQLLGRSPRNRICCVRCRISVRTPTSISTRESRINSYCSTARREICAEIIVIDDIDALIWKRDLHDNASQK